MMSKNPKLSIVIVEYNSVDEIASCVEAIREKVDISYEIIVSSNSCYGEDKRKELSAKPADNVVWLFNPKNGGFAYAMNKGLKVAKGDYLVIMNSDCLINFNISDIAQFMSKHPEVGAVGPKIHDANGNLQDTARPYVSVPRFLWRQIKRVMCHETSILNPFMDYGVTQTVDWIIGAFIMVSRKAYELTGGLDDNYFMYAEDLDWCTRIRQQGLEVVYYADSDVTYKGTRRARENRAYAKIFFRSHWIYWRKFGFVYGYPKRKHLQF